MNTINQGQENGYLESPYVVKDTGFEGQTPFSIKNPLEGGFSFSKKGFFTEPAESILIDQDSTDSDEELNEKLPLSIPCFNFEI
jgi:hypothetical protein